MTSSPKMVGEEKGCRPCLVLTTLLLNISLSLSLSLSLDQFGCCGMIFGKLYRRMVKRSLWFDVVFFCLFLSKHCKRDTLSSSLCLPLLIHFLSVFLYLILLCLFFLSCFSLSPLAALLTFLLPVPFFGRPCYLITHSPSCSFFSLSLSLHRFLGLSGSN